MWLVCGWYSNVVSQYVVGMWSVCGWYVVSMWLVMWSVTWSIMWSVCGWYLVSMWLVQCGSVCGWYNVVQYNVVMWLVIKYGLQCGQ